MTVKQLRTMDNSEFVRWRIYYGRIAQQQDLEHKLQGGG